MQIVIDIPESWEKCNIRFIKERIKNGTPLPEHHGDLIDRDELPQDDMDRANYPSNFVRLAKTIIPATKGE